MERSTEQIARICGVEPKAITNFKNKEGIRSTKKLIGAYYFNFFSEEDADFIIRYFTATQQGRPKVLRELRQFLSQKTPDATAHPLVTDRRCLVFIGGPKPLLFVSRRRNDRLGENRAAAQRKCNAAGANRIHEKRRELFRIPALPGGIQMPGLQIMEV